MTHPLKNGDHQGKQPHAHKPVEGATEKPLNLSAELWHYTVSVTSKEKD